MPRHRSFLVVVLCLALGSPLLASTAPRKAMRGAPVPSQALSGQLGRLWQRLTALWGAEGCGIDPNGKPLCAPAPTGSTAVTPLVPEGCGIDPDGRCNR